jgi:hypothetical protein
MTERDNLNEDKLEALGSISTADLLSYVERRIASVEKSPENPVDLVTQLRGRIQESEEKLEDVQTRIGEIGVEIEHPSFSEGRGKTRVTLSFFEESYELLKEGIGVIIQFKDGRTVHLDPKDYDDGWYIDRIEDLNSIVSITKYRAQY